MVATAAGARGDRDTSSTHLDEASALAARMDTEVGTWANPWFEPTSVGFYRTSLALKLGEHGWALQVAKTVHPELLPAARPSSGLMSAAPPDRREEDPPQGCAYVAARRATRPQRIRNDVLVRETVADLLRQARRDAGGRELRGLAWCMGIAPLR